MAEAARKIPYSSYRSASALRYDGNAVRIPDGNAIPQPRVLPRERPATRPKVRTREAGHFSLFAVTGSLFIAILAFFLLFGQTKLHAMSHQAVALQEEYELLKNEETRLLTRYELTYDLKSIETAVTGPSGRMTNPQESQIFYMDLSGNDSVTLFEEEDSSVRELLDQASAYLK